MPLHDPGGRRRHLDDHGVLDAPLPVGVDRDPKAVHPDPALPVPVTATRQRGLLPRREGDGGPPPRLPLLRRPAECVVFQLRMVRGKKWRGRRVHGMDAACPPIPSDGQPLDFQRRAKTAPHLPAPKAASGEALDPPAQRPPGGGPLARPAPRRLQPPRPSPRSSSKRCRSSP